MSVQFKKETVSGVVVLKATTLTIHERNRFQFIFEPIRNRREIEGHAYVHRKQTVEHSWIAFGEVFEYFKWYVATIDEKKTLVIEMMAGEYLQSTYKIYRLPITTDSYRNSKRLVKIVLTQLLQDQD